MKTKFKKRFYFAALMAALLVSAALVAGCMGPLDIPAKQESGDEDVSYNIPAGKGIVRLKIADSNAKSILPNTSAALSTMTFDVVITSLTPTPANDLTLTNRTLTQIQTAIVLTAGDTYTVVLTGFNAAHTIPIAGWTQTPVAVNTGFVTPLTANLIAIVDGTDQGTFSYNVTAPTITGGYSVATLDVWEYGQTSTTSDFNSGSALTLTGGTAAIGTASLDSGYYIVTITLKKLNYQDRVVTNVMHIYPALTSQFTYSVPDISKNKFTVNFNLGSVVDDLGSDFATGGKGTQLVNNADMADDPGDPEDEDGLLDFGGWYYDYPTFLLPWYDTDLVFKDTTVFAKWTADEGVTITITFTLPSDASITLTGSALPVSYNDLVGGFADLTFTLTGGTFTGVTWDLDGTPIGTGNSITIDGTSAFLAAFVTGTHVINVEGTRNSAPWSAVIDITIDND